MYPVTLFLGDFMEYTNTWIRERIAEYVHSERDRQVLVRRLVDGVTIERLAEEFDLSVGGVKGILRRYRAVLAVN